MTQTISSSCYTKQTAQLAHLGWPWLLCLASGKIGAEANRLVGRCLGSGGRGLWFYELFRIVIINPLATDKERHVGAVVVLR